MRRVPSSDAVKVSVYVPLDVIIVPPLALLVTILLLTTPLSCGLKVPDVLLKLLTVYFTTITSPVAKR